VWVCGEHSRSTGVKGLSQGMQVAQPMHSPGRTLAWCSASEEPSSSFSKFRCSRAGSFCLRLSLSKLAFSPRRGRLCEVRKPLSPARSSAIVAI
jgi:hypothetical protein